MNLTIFKGGKKEVHTNQKGLKEMKTKGKKEKEAVHGLTCNYYIQTPVDY